MLLVVVEAAAAVVGPHMEEQLQEEGVLQRSCLPADVNTQESLAEVEEDILAAVEGNPAHRLGLVAPQQKEPRPVAGMALPGARSPPQGPEDMAALRPCCSAVAAAAPLPGTARRRARYRRAGVVRRWRPRGSGLRGGRRVGPRAGSGGSWAPG